MAGFLGKDCVQTRRQGRACKDTDRRSGWRRVAERVAGRRAPRNRQGGRAIRRQIGKVNRIAVDGGVVMGRHVAAGDKIGGEKPATAGREGTLR